MEIEHVPGSTTDIDLKGVHADVAAVEGVNGVHVSHCLLMSMPGWLL